MATYIFLGFHEYYQSKQEGCQQSDHVILLQAKEQLELNNWITATSELAAGNTERFILFVIERMRNISESNESEYVFNFEEMQDIEKVTQY